MSARLAALIFAGLTAVVMLFQLALALGAPWGAYAMGGTFPGVFPPVMRVAALVQIALLAVLALTILARGGVVRVPSRRAVHILAWLVTGFMAVGVVLNIITPSSMERMIWAPVAVILFASSLRVTLAR